MNKTVEDMIAEDAKRLDEAYYALGDGLDVKASIILVALTFLGTLSGQILSLPALPMLIKILQAASVAALCAVGVLVITCLWLKEFKLPPKPDESENWVVQLTEHFTPQASTPESLDAQVSAEFQKKRKEARLERISSNGVIVTRKAGLIKWSFRIIALAVASEFTCLIWLAFWHL